MKGTRIGRVALIALGLTTIGCGSSELTGQFGDDCRGAACETAPELDNLVQSNLPTNGIVDRPSSETLPFTLDLAIEEPAGEDPSHGTPLVTEDDLDEEEAGRIEALRTSISYGLDIGRTQYVEEVQLTLFDLGVIDDYDLAEEDPTAGLDQEVVECPFVQNLGNGFESTGRQCDYLVEIAKIEVYSELAEELDRNPLPSELLADEIAEEADFWYEQGAISGLEEGRVRVRHDMKDRELCNAAPTPIESSYDNGVLVGRRLFAEAFNTHLARNGFTADYPEMSDPIEVCNANQAFLEPARQAAINSVGPTVDENPLCPGYSAPTSEMLAHYGQAEIDYAKGVRDGIDDEFGLAVVSVFRVVPCVVADPLVIDLDGDGLELTTIAGGVNFDMRADGHAQAVAWVQADDGFLALDRNGNGKIDNGAELFGNTERDVVDGFADLAALDSNHDGVLTSADPMFASLVVWRDADQDAASAPAELISVTQLGVSRIPVVGTPSALSSGGNQITAVAHITGDGVRLLMGDAFLGAAPYPRLSRR